MTVDELYQQLKTVLEKLNARNIDDDTKLDLEILVLQLKRQMIVASFDPLKDLSQISMADLTKLKQLTLEVDQEIENETKRKEKIQKIVATAKLALNAAGVPLPG